jgi:hypothetical protein
MALNYYNAFIMHLMYVEIFEILKQKKMGTSISWKLVWSGCAGSVSSRNG